MIQSLNLLTKEGIIRLSNLWKAGGKLPESARLSKKISTISIFFAHHGTFNGFAAF
jgi:hypothetical protein